MEFGLGLGPADQRGFAPADPFHAAGRIDFGRPGANGYFGGAIGIDGDAVIARLSGADAHRGGIDVDVGAGIAGNVPRESTAAKFDGVAAIFDFGQAEVRLGGNAEAIGAVELKFGARGEAGEETVGGDQRGVDRGGDDIVRVAAADGDIAVDETDAGDATAGDILGFRTSS